MAMDRQGPSLITLPCELILQVCELGLQGWNDPYAGPMSRVTENLVRRRSLCALLRTHSRLHKIVAPVFYKHLIPPVYDTSQLKKLVDTLETNPLLAGLVRSIRFPGGGFPQFLDIAPTNASLFARLIMQTSNMSDLQFHHAAEMKECLSLSSGFTSAPQIQKLTCGAHILSREFARQFPNLRVLDLDGDENFEPDDADDDEPPWKLTGVEDLSLQIEDGNIEWYPRMLEYFPSLRKLCLRDRFAEESPHPLLEELQSKRTAVIGSHLLHSIQARCPSLETLHLQPKPWEFPDAPMPGIHTTTFPQFSNLTRLEISSFCLDFNGKGNVLKTVCRGCPRLQSISLLEVQIHGVAVCDTLLSLATYIAKTRKLGRDFAAYLEEIKVSGSWSQVWADKNYEIASLEGSSMAKPLEESDSEELRDLKLDWNEYWVSISEAWAAQKHVNVLRSEGISYEEELWWPWDFIVADDGTVEDILL
ncbi:hypothetical protein V8F20_008560 [Naviculisporaceae sp. PSN 640]